MHATLMANLQPKRCMYSPPRTTHIPSNCFTARVDHLTLLDLSRSKGRALAHRARAGHALGIFSALCPTGDLLGGALSAVRVHCNYLDV